MPLPERLSQVVSLNLIGLVLYLIIDLPVQKLNVTILDSSVIVAVSLQFLVVFVLGGLAFVGVGVVLDTPSGQWLRDIHPFWINPTLLVILAALTLVYFGSVFYWVSGLFIAGVLLWLSLWAAYHQAAVLQRLRYRSQQDMDPKTVDRLHRAGRWSEWLGYALFLGYSLLIFQSDFSVLIRLISLAFLAFFFAQTIFHTPDGIPRRILVYATTVGWIVAQLVLIFSLLHLGSLAQGLLTGLSFYLSCGLPLTYLRGTLSRAVVIEYSVIGFAGSLLILLIT
ncbi:MAG: hypothetical protein AAF629_25085 [Chloroflexota bacterium]